MYVLKEKTLNHNKTRLFMLNSSKCQSDERPKITTKCLYCNVQHNAERSKYVNICDKSLGNFRALATVHYCAAVVYHRNFPGLITEVMLQ